MKSNFICLQNLNPCKYNSKDLKSLKDFREVFTP